MTQVRWSLPETGVVILPAGGDPAWGSNDVAQAAAHLVAGRSPVDDHVAEALHAALATAAEQSAAADDASVFIWPSTADAACVLRLTVIQQPMTAELLYAWREAPTENVPGGPNEIVTNGLGDGQFDTAVWQSDGQALGIARWTFSKRGGSVAAVLGPAGFGLLALALPIADALMTEVQVTGLDSDGEAYAQQASMLPAIERETWETAFSDR